MRPGGGKAKGAQFEREMCVLLSKWLTSGDREDIFWRSAMSGGRATVAYRSTGKKHAAQSGDISCVDPLGDRFIKAFNAECKFYRDLDYTGLLTGKGKLIDFWKQTKRDARIHSKHPFLIARQNRMPAVVGLDINARKELGLSYKDMILISIPNNLHLLFADEFFKRCKPYL